jgi:D-alanine-D-alanine ligase
MESAVVVEDHPQLVHEVSELLSELDRPVLIEQFAPGREIVLGILGNGDTVTILPPLEIVRPANDEDVIQVQDLACPASLSDEQVEMLYLLARRAYAIQRFQDAARLDIVLTAEGPMLLRANPLVRLPAAPKDPGSYLGLMAQDADTNVVSELAHITAQRLELEPAQATTDN